VFLAPFHRATPNGRTPAHLEPHQGYDAFVEEIVEAARRFGYHAETSPGPGDPRIRGARQ
jgi:hypothetical protein